MYLPTQYKNLRGSVNSWHFLQIELCSNSLPFSTCDDFVKLPKLA